MKMPARSKKASAAKPRAVRERRGAKLSDIIGRAGAADASSGRVPAKWKWHYGVLLSLQGRLLRERGEARCAVAEPLEPHSLDEADSATDESDHDLALTQLSAEQDALYEVGAALQRIVDGSYGVCEETGKAIPAARLKAIPWARFTREAEERLESKGMVRPARLNKAGTVRSKGRIWLAPEEEDEESAETPPAPAKDEELSSVFTPTAGDARQKPPRCGPKKATRKGTSK